MQTEHIRQHRQEAIISILGEARVMRQSQIVDLLQARGIPATQSGVSRDLRRLGIAKRADGCYAPAQPPQTADENIIGQLLQQLRTAGPHLTVLVTATGAAQRLAVMLDRSGWPEITGTVSGDDTVFVATPGASEQRRLVARLQSSMAR